MFSTLTSPVRIHIRSKIEKQGICICFSVIAWTYLTAVVVCPFICEHKLLSQKGGKENQVYTGLPSFIYRSLLASTEIEEHIQFLSAIPNFNFINIFQSSFLEQHLFQSLILEVKFPFSPSHFHVHCFLLSYYHVLASSQLVHHI